MLSSTVDNETLKAEVDYQVEMITIMMMFMRILIIIIIIGIQVVSGNIFQFGRENIYTEV